MRTILKTQYQTQLYPERFDAFEFASIAPIPAELMEYEIVF